MKTIQLLIATLLIYSNLSAQNCEAWFYPYHNSENYLTIDFQDGSIPQNDIQTWQWDFGDGNTSDLQSPSHTYTTEGIYTVVLIINSGNCNDSYSQDITITSTPASSCVADFYYSISGNENKTVNFTDNSNITGANKQWNWNFGDGTASTEQSPTHIYSSDGTYRVSLKAMSDECLDSVTYMVVAGENNQGDACLASYSHEVLDPAGNTIQFFDASYIPGGIADAYLWNFGDGTTDITANPIHSFPANGEYIVELTINSGECTSSFSNVIYTGDNAWYPESCQALYWFTTEAENHRNFQFYDYSYGNDAILAWFWDFGDGTYSTQANPTHEFTSDGDYLTSLTINTYDCSSTFDININVSENSASGDSLMPLFYPETTLNSVQFHNLTRGNADSWEWNFGDGNTSTLKNPVHNFDEPGIHEVSLAAYDGSNVNTIVMRFNTSALKGNYNTDIENVFFFPGMYSSVYNIETFEFSIFPNPTNDFIDIKTSQKNINIAIYDISGRCVLKQNSNQRINIKNLKSGIYIIKINNKDMSGTAKFTKF